MVKLVHPHIFESSFSLCHGKYLALVETDHEYSKDHDSQQDANGDFWNFGHRAHNVPYD
jgi:hypothetical protein